MAKTPSDRLLLSLQWLLGSVGGLAAAGAIVVYIHDAKVLDRPEPGPAVFTFYDHDIEQPVEVPEKRATEALRSGRYTMGVGARINLVDPFTGAARSFGSGELYDATREGWEVETTAQAYRRQQLRDLWTTTDYAASPVLPFAAVAASLTPFCLLLAMRRWIRWVKTGL